MYRAEKRCPACKQVKPASEYHRSARRKDGLLAYCKACWAERGRTNKYKISESEYLALVERQNGECAICRQAVALVVDHCHTSQAVRGLLCSRCNVGLGYFLDDPKRLRSAADYLDAGTLTANAQELSRA